MGFARLVCGEVAEMSVSKDIEEIATPTVTEFIDGYFRPMVKLQDTAANKLRGELRGAEQDLEAVRHVIQMLNNESKPVEHR
jgi:hypothetical protein